MNMSYYNIDIIITEQIIWFYNRIYDYILCEFNCTFISVKMDKSVH